MPADAVEPCTKTENWGDGPITYPDPKRVKCIELDAVMIEIRAEWERRWRQTPAEIHWINEFRKGIPKLPRSRSQFRRRSRSTSESGTYMRPVWNSVSQNMVGQLRYCSDACWAEAQEVHRPAHRRTSAAYTAKRSTWHAQARATLQCRRCGAPLDAARSTRLFCSTRCRVADHRSGAR